MCVTSLVGEETHHTCMHTNLMKKCVWQLVGSSTLWLFNSSDGLRSVRWVSCLHMLSCLFVAGVAAELVAVDGEAATVIGSAIAAWASAGSGWTAAGGGGSDATDSCSAEAMADGCGNNDGPGDDVTC